MIDLPCNAHWLNLASRDQINGALLHTGRAVALQPVLLLGPHLRPKAGAEAKATGVGAEAEAARGGPLKFLQRQRSRIARRSGQPSWPAWRAVPIYGVSARRGIP